MRADTTFSDFNRDHGAAIRLLPGAHLTLNSVTFRRTELEGPDSPMWHGIGGSALAAVNGSKISLQVCLPRTAPPVHFPGPAHLLHLLMSLLFHRTLLVC